MKNGIFVMAGIALLCACNNSASETSNVNDSLGSTTADTSGRGDTAYYERMNQKTGVPDTGSQLNNPKRNDTAYYERMPNKPPDSVK